ncbi:hypothetical protein [Serpentinicella alkaliphila]|uniref:Tripartite tricarboxylate transporter TctB family protein n=1 Tax=Serpentinicella alkaliphila TaxID=1734049 RepID=A0A4R2TNQ9_9FIRM|nr:hypothetical protein [Serpentinicella alkaliphila]QUH26554.1 hypothetical protein HZR23_13045 [Serpentinicella alkaliphila]TCP99038.1 hypothetical protein EDD79_10371 [Serpentinicella alkaliphila]
MSRKIILGIFISIVFLFLSEYIEVFVSPYFDPKYILHIILLTISILMILLGISIIKEQTVGDNLLDIIISFRRSGMYFILIGCFFLLIAILRWRSL